ncbi:uncharacterized protein LOC143241804 [Tachypleus tridentatus]|uniref:uncharacterized protein LOC143241804 n=1 Tax=Tachypleus tridentatus TaxID=6853 RepID=UPI003FD21EAF
MSRWFQINFPMEAYNIFVSMGYTGEIKDTFLKTVRTLTGISSLRIPKVLIDFDKDQMYVSALLLERPPYFYDFNVNENKRFKSPTSSLGLTTPQDCAKSCLESIEICWGFSYCGVTCYLTSKTYSDNDLIEDKDCNVYKRVINPENTTPTSDMVISQLYNLVSTGNLFFSVKPSDNDMITYKALELFNDLASGINGLVYRPSDDLDSKFTVFKYTSKFDKSEEQNTKDVGRVFFDDCKRACVNLEMCESLSFCGLTGECLLSTKHGNEIPDDHIKKDSQCIILTRNYVVSYERLPGITSGSKPKKSLAIKDLNNCAKACSTEKDFDCKSFDHCPQSTESDLTCLLHETHFLDAKDTFVGDKASVCGHYTRDYIFDFKKTDGKKENGAKIVELQNVTAKACAKQCVDNADFNCQGFDFCQGTPLGQSSCFLIGKGNSNLKLIDAPVCAHYDYLGGNSVGTGDKKKRYSSGLAAGLSFFFIALGAVVGVVAFYMYSSRRVKN